MIMDCLTDKTEFSMDQGCRLVLIQYINATNVNIIVSVSGGISILTMLKGSSPLSEEFKHRCTIDSGLLMSNI